MKRISKEDLDGWNDDRKRARFINCLSGIKSCFLVGTCNASKQTNLAIFSSIFHLGANPSLMGLIVRPNVSSRHTFENIKMMGFYSLNLLPYQNHQQGHQTSARYSLEQSEFLETGFSEEWTEDGPVPFVKESQVKWLMKYIRTVDIPENGTHMVIGEVQCVYLPDDLIESDGSLTISQTDPALVTGLDCYHQVRKGIRYSYAKPGKDLTKI